MGAWEIVGIVLLSLLLLLSLVYLLILVRPRAGAPGKAELLCDYAHRGLYGSAIPENSLAAFARACERGVGIELDVQLSRDGVVMVFHDDTLQRMTGCKGRLCEYDAATLQGLSLAGTEQGIPTFAQVLALVDGRVPLLIELKGESFDTSLCPVLASLLREYEGAYCIESFNPLLLRRMRQCLSGAFYGLLYTNVCRDKKKRSVLNMLLTCMSLNALARPDFIAYNQVDRGALPVRLTTGLYGAARFVWTVKPDDAIYTSHRADEHLIFETEPRQEK